MRANSKYFLKCNISITFAKIETKSNVYHNRLKTPYLIEELVEELLSTSFEGQRINTNTNSTCTSNSSYYNKILTK